MKKLILLIVLVTGIYAKMVGVVSAAKGDVEVLREGDTMEVQVGFEVNEKDTITTHSNAKAQIFFKDKTVITIGKDSEFTISEFILKKGEEKASFSVSKGLFKAMTGAVGQKYPEKFSIKTRTTSIGIRGTHFFGKISSEQDSIACTQGAITVQSDAGGLPVEVNAGEITFVALGDLPTPPRAFSAQEIQQISSSLDESSEEMTTETTTENEKMQETQKSFIFEKFAVYESFIDKIITDVKDKVTKPNP